MVFFSVFFLIWLCIGLIILKVEMERENQKLSDLTFKEYLKVAIKACFYGPFTKSKVIDKL